MSIQTLQQTGHAKDGLPSFNAPPRVSRLLSWGVRRRRRESRMSFIHYTLVGHFDAPTVSSRNLTVSRPIDPDRVSRLLTDR
jgi:hypothetical protein